MNGTNWSRLNSTVVTAVRTFWARCRKALSFDLQERVMAAYSVEEGTREEIASRFMVSLAW